MARSAVALGGTVFAAWMMIVAGAWQVLVGIAAISKDEFFVAGADYAYEFDTTGWGWIHLVIGAVAVVIGFSLFTGTSWARALGVAIAIGSLISNFMWLPFQPWWSIMVIALDVFIIWSLVNVGDALRFPDQDKE
ncbi:DUF7144 family membrane protein [Glycomyces tenuis]|uniref:DUF7144 family membrane protein n=1 Tax=Glycomyces tenuis TaxID=58116 RepID=UPI0006862A29|nr:hypothetical protein [Glycomyces tenuis]